MNIKELGYLGGNVFTYILTALQTNEIYQLVELILSVVTSLLIIIFKIITWWKKAKADGKITKEEIDELTDSIKDDVDHLK